MIRHWARAIAISLPWLIAAQAGAQQFEGCALAIGATPANTLAFQPVFRQPDPQTALNLAAASFQRPGHRYIDGAAAANGGIAIVLYTHLSGEEQVKSVADSTAYGAIMGALDSIAGIHNTQRVPYVKWVRCTYSEQLTREQLAQLTWGNNLTARYPGYRAQEQEFTENYGSFYFMPPAGGTAPPNPTPVPRDWSGTPVGCWQRYDHVNRPDGNIISMLPETLSDGRQQFVGRHVVLSAVQISAGRQLKDVGLRLEPAPQSRPPENYRGSYEFDSGNRRSDGFTVTADTISGGLSAKPEEKFTWRRVNCPR